MGGGGGARDAAAAEIPAARSRLNASRPLLPLAPIGLRARGHSVALRTLASEVEVMRGLGFDAAPIDPAIEAIEHDDYVARTPLGAQRRALQTSGRRAKHDLRDLRRAIGEVAPDAVIVDANAWRAMVAAEAWGGPWASWIPYPLPLPSRDAPPYGPGFRPARGPLGRACDAALGSLMFEALAGIARPYLKARRAECGLPPLSDSKRIFTGIPLLLAMTAEPFEYPHADWPSTIRLVGPERSAKYSG